MPTATPDIIRRLSLIRLLLHGAEAAAGQPAPFNTDSINRLHDVCEMYLALAVELHHGSIPKDFMGYWPELERLTGQPLSFRAALQRMNKARVSLKHYGVQPNSSEVAHCVASVRNLLLDETPRLFGVALAEASLDHFVQSDEGARCIQTAENHWDAGEKGEALADLREAYDSVLAWYEATKHGPSQVSVFDLYSKFQRTNVFRRPADPEQVKYEDSLHQLLSELDERLMVIGLGIDLRRLGRFLAMTPSVRLMANGVDRWYSVPEDFDPSSDDYAFCRDFVVSVALRLAEFDFEVDSKLPYAGGRSWWQMRSRSATLPTDGAEPE